MSVAEIFTGNRHLLERVQARYREDTYVVSEPPSLQDLLNYSDFSDSNNLLQKHKDCLTSPLSSPWRRKARRFFSSRGVPAPIRERKIRLRLKAPR